MAKTQKVIIYGRRSPDRNETLDSVNQQLTDLREYCRVHGYEVMGEFRDDALSGAGTEREDRPGLWDAIDRLKPGWVLMVRNFDRLSRDSDGQVLIVLEIRKKGAYCYSMNESRDLVETPLGKALRGILAAMADLEREMIRARTSRAMRAYQKNGRSMSSRTPYGTRLGPDRIETKPDGTIEKIHTLESEPSEQAVIERICTMYKEGKTPYAICKTLTDVKVPARMSKWYVSTIETILARAGLKQPPPCRLPNHNPVKRKKVEPVAAE